MPKAIMCLFRVKEEPAYSVQARRTTRFQRERTYAASPPQVANVSSARFIEERRASKYISVSSGGSKTDPEPLSPSKSYSEQSTTQITGTTPATRVRSNSVRFETRVSEEPTRHSSAQLGDSTQLAQPISAGPRTRTHYVEVEHEKSRSRSGSISDGATDFSRSRAQHSPTMTERPTRSATAVPASEYRSRASEDRRERTRSDRRPDFTRKRSHSLPDQGRRNASMDDHGNPRTSLGGLRRVHERYWVEEDYGRRRSDYIQ